MKKLLIGLSLVIIASYSYAQQKFALVIGNSNYAGISGLNSPVNDADDMEAALRALGFTVEIVKDGNLEQMYTAVENLKRRLGGSRSSYGFFFYSGHGVQSNGVNYLIPVEANNILNDTHLRQSSLSLQYILDNMSEAANELNMIVLDACRDNPFEWAESGGRGLSVVSRVPLGSIVMYAARADSEAADGNGRNSLFTSRLLNNLKTQGLSVFDVFDRTMDDVINVTGGRQRPELSLRFSGAASAYLGSRPALPAAAANPESARTHYDRGEGHRSRGEWDAAIGEYTEAIRLNPNYADAYNVRGIVYHSGKFDFDRAIADYNEAIRLNPNNATFYNNRGVLYNIRRDFDRAITDLNEAIRLNSNFANAFCERGYSYEYKGDYDRAIVDYNEAIRLNPNYALAHNNRGNAYYRKRDYDRAITDYSEAIRLNPNYALAFQNRGTAYQARGDTTRASADFARARELGYR